MSDTHFQRCSFSSTDELRGKTLTYENVKACVLKAGKFSAFEASQSQKHAYLFTQLCRDPELIVDNKAFGFPWTKVALKDRT